jgi:hypothetical protein
MQLALHVRAAQRTLPVLAAQLTLHRARHHLRKRQQSSGSAIQDSEV